jgi:hypothetical protein
METFVGDIVTLSFETGVDLSNTTLSILYRKPNGSTGSWPGTLNPSDHSIVYYITDENDLNIDGIWKLQVYASSVVIKSHGNIVDLFVREPLAGYVSNTTAPPITTVAPTTIEFTTALPTTTSSPTTTSPTTLGGTTSAPTTLSPTTISPTTLVTTLAPTTLAPTPPPTTLAPTTLTPPTTLAPTPAPTTLAPTTTLTTPSPTTIPPYDLGDEIHASPITTSLADDDEFVVAKASAYPGMRILWSTIKSILKTYFDTLYNNYVHPLTHSPSIITQDASNRFFTDTERTKLSGIATGANNYVHPASHSPSIITQDASNRFFTDTERTKLAGIATSANNYVHPTGDGNSHVPATGTTSNGKILMAGATAGSMSWQSAGAITGFLQISDFSFTDGVSNFPAATKGDFLQVTNEGWLGGVTGVGEYINENDLLYCNTTTASGTKAAVGQNWNVIRRIIAQPDGHRYVEMVSNTVAPTGITNGYYFLSNVMYKIQNGVHTAI